MCLGVKLGDDPAGGFLKQARDQGMDKRGTRGGKKEPRKLESKRHMLEETLIHFGGMVQKNA